MPPPVTRYPNGVTTVPATDPLAMFGMPDPTKWHSYFEDFDYYLAGDWTITNASAGTVALADIDGGAILITNAAGDDNAIFLNKKGEGFLLEAGKRAFFKARFKISDVTQSDFVIGLQVTDTTPLDVVDGIYFLKTDGAATLDVFCRKDAATGSTTAAAIATLVNDTFVTVALYYDGVGTLSYYVNDVIKGQLVATSAYLPDQELTVSIGLQNGEAVSKNATIDYVFVAEER